MPILGMARENRALPPDPAPAPDDDEPTPTLEAMLGVLSDGGASAGPIEGGGSDDGKGCTGLTVGWGAPLNVEASS